jgi:hypothetical protein
METPPLSNTARLKVGSRAGGQQAFLQEQERLAPITFTLSLRAVCSTTHRVRY